MKIFVKEDCKLILPVAKLSQVEDIFRKNGLLETHQGVWVTHVIENQFRRYTGAWTAHVAEDDKGQRFLVVYKDVIFVDTEVPDIRAVEEENMPPELRERMREIETQIHRLLFLNCSEVFFK